MTSVASEVFALLNRPSPSSRASAAKSGQDDGGFAAMMESHAERPDEPRPARTERNQPRSSIERDTAADKPARVDSAQRETPDSPDKPKAADQTSPKAAAEGDNTAKPAGDIQTVADEVKGEEKIITGIVPAALVEAVAAAPSVPVVEATPVVAPVEIVPANPTPVPADAAAEVAPAVVTPVETVTAPAQTNPEQPVDTAGQAGVPEEAAAKADAAPADVEPQQAATAATIVPPVKAQTTAKTETETKAEKAVVSGTSADTDADEASLEAAGETEDATQKSRPAVNQNANAQAQAQIDKPGAKPEQTAKLDDGLPAPKLTIDHLTQSMPQMTTHAVANTAAASQQTAASPVSTSQAIPLNAVAVEIAAQAKLGHSRFEIRLDPAELGRIDVRLDIDKDGNVSSRLVIERADTYDLLRRDQSTLERALQQAGLKTSDNALEFSLRDQGFNQQQQKDDETSRGVRTLVAESDVMPSEAANGYARMLGGRSGVDIRV